MLVIMLHNTYKQYNLKSQYLQVGHNEDIVALAPKTTTLSFSTIHVPTRAY